MLLPLVNQITHIEIVFAHKLPPGTNRLTSPCPNPSISIHVDSVCCHLMEFPVASTNTVKLPTLFALLKEESILPQLQS